MDILLHINIFRFPFVLLTLYWNYKFNFYNYLFLNYKFKQLDAKTGFSFTKVIYCLGS